MDKAIKYILWLVEKINKYFIFLLILLFSFLLRVYGIYFDYPTGLNFIWDEIFSVSYIFDVIQTKNIFTGTYQYPLLLPLIYIPGIIIRSIYISLTQGICDIDTLKKLK